MRWYWWLLLYIVIAVIVYAVVYSVYFAPAPMPTNGGEPCVPSYYNPCP